MWVQAAYDSPRSTALTHCAIKLAEDALCETAYLADIAGLHYSISPEGRLGARLPFAVFACRCLLQTAQSWWYTTCTIGMVQATQDLSVITTTKLIKISKENEAQVWTSRWRASANACHS